MKEKIRALKKRCQDPQTEEKARVDLQKLLESDPDAFGRSMLELADETIFGTKELILREKLSEILEIVSPAYVARTYFGSSSSWLHQRLNGNSGNGRPAEFTPDELKTLDFALQDISKKIGSVRVS